MSQYQHTLQQVEAYLESLSVSNTHSGLYYHHAGHTRDVIATALQMASHYRLEEKDLFILITAASFHDVGYFTTSPTEKHEEKSAEMAVQFLADKDVEADAIEAVQNCILATGPHSNPASLLEKILADADTFYMGSDDFAEKNKLLRKETEALNNVEISKEAWRRRTIKQMEAHRYHTDYCQALLYEKKSENLGKLRLKELEKSGQALVPDKTHEPSPALIPQAASGSTHTGKDMPETKEEKKKDKRPERGIETVFRTTSSNNQQLSNQADNKAHIMIQVNAIVISVLLSILLSNKGTPKNLTAPIIVLLIVNVVTIIFAMLATRPNIPTGKFTNQEIDTKKVNLLFFGNFYKMGLDEYMDGMLKMMDDYDFLYRSLIRDIYHQGVVLGKKYQLLRMSYSVFMFGLVISVLAFVAVFVTLH